jgi:hypothetical protein
MANEEANDDDIIRHHARLQASRTLNYDEDDPLKYTVPQSMYRRVPRWRPNDGIDEYRTEHYNKRQIKALRGMSSLLLTQQKELTEMLGH